MRRRRPMITMAMILGVILLAIQLFRPGRNEGAQEGPAAIGKVYKMPDTVAAILRTACYDCHSDRTQYPWYAEVQPVGWWLASHIKDAKHELNFSVFGQYSVARQRSKLVDLAHSLEDGSMPLQAYRWMHAEARLLPAQTQLVVTWAHRVADSLSTKN